MQLPPTILSVGKTSNIRSDREIKENKSNASGGKVTSKKIEPKEAAIRDMQILDATDMDSGSEDDNCDQNQDENNPPDKSNIAATKEKKKGQRSGLRPPRTLETTLFDRLEEMHGPGVKRMLNVQYRYVCVADYSSSLSNVNLWSVVCMN